MSDIVKHGICWILAVFLVTGTIVGGVYHLTKEDHAKSITERIAERQYYDKRVGEAISYCKPRGGHVDLVVTHATNQITTICKDGSFITQPIKEKN